MPLSRGQQAEAERLVSQETSRFAATNPLETLASASAFIALAALNWRNANASCCAVYAEAARIQCERALAIIALHTGD